MGETLRESTGLIKTGYSKLAFVHLLVPSLIRQFKVRYDTNFVDTMVKDYDSKAKFL